MEKIKKNSRGLGIIIGVLVVLVVGLFAFLVYDNGLSNNKNEKEVSISDPTIKNELSLKINLLNAPLTFSNSTEVEDSIIIQMGSEVNTNLYKELNLTESDKTWIVYKSLIDEFQPISISKENMSGNIRNHERFDEAWFLGDLRQLSKNVFEERYLSLFGTSYVHHDDESLGFYLDDVNQVYYVNPDMGGLADNRRIYLYKNKYTKVNDYAYVYVSVGASGYKDENGGLIYNDVVEEWEGTWTHDDVVIYKEGLTDDELKQFRIDATNYKSFQEYKFTFKKNRNGEYSFVGVEKVR